MRSMDPSTFRIIDLWHFKSTKSNKRYIVEVENFSNHFFGLKFYWKGVADSKDRYSLLTNDYEPRTIVMSCIQIMFNYFEKDNCASFGFVAARDLLQPDNCGMPNKRFRFYRRMMLNTFGPITFAQASDRNKSLYIMINRMMLANGIVSISMIEQEISKLYEGEYALALEP